MARRTSATQIISPYVTNDLGTVFQQYLYANGRPVRFKANSGVPAYYRYNWHGDVVGFVASNGDGMRIWKEYDGWGELTDRFPGQYYNWMGAWGYLKFRGEFNYRANGLFYTHGRWYNADVGLFLSPVPPFKGIHGRIYCCHVLAGRLLRKWCAPTPVRNRGLASPAPSGVEGGRRNPATIKKPTFLTGRLFRCFTRDGKDHELSRCCE